MLLTYLETSSLLYVSLGPNGWAQFGLSHRHVIFLLEQLPGAHTCFRYRFRYHRYRINQIREKVCHF